MSPAKVLIVEDEIIVQRHLQRLLERLGHRVVGAASRGDQALVLARRNPPDLVMMDVRLQGEMDGIEVARSLRRDGEVAVVFLTAYADDATLERAREAEAAGYLVKPFEESDVQAAVSTALAKERTVRRLRSHGRDLTSILDELEVGTAMVDEDGRISFLSRPACRRLGVEAAETVGRPWEEALPLDSDDSTSGKPAIELRRLIEASPSERRRLPLATGAGQERRQLEVDVRDDPRDPGQRILFFYDVTEASDLRRLLEVEVNRHGMVGSGPTMRRVFGQIDQVAAAAAPVFIEGETGTGKELVARAVHGASPRSGGPFVAVNCAGLTESLLASQLFGHKKGAFTGAFSDHRGFFEMADGGTLFLDEIGDISMPVQTSLLRVLEDGHVTPLGSTSHRKVDVRIVTATHRDLGDEVEAGRFRADLVYRIRVARLRLPPLRERGEDLELLAHYFLDRCRAAAGRPPMRFSAAALALLSGHLWPGNVRELRSAIEHAVICCRGEEISPADLPPEVVPAVTGRSGLSLHDARSEQEERERIVAALEEVRGNRSKAAKILGISRATLYRRLDQLDMT